MNLENIEFLNKAKEKKTLKDYNGKLYLIINTASKCGFTPQFEGLEKLNKEYKDSGLVTLGFPCDQFKDQEFDTASEAEEFCKLNYGVTFEILDKVDVNGEKEAPLFTELKSQKKGLLGSSKIKWNFTKFLVDENFKVVKRYGSATKPENIEKDIKKYLK